MINPARVPDNGKIDIELWQAFPVKIDHFVVPENNGSADIQYPAVGKDLYDQFYSNAIQITGSNTDNRFMFM